MVARVADHVDQRIADFLDDIAVELDILALDFELDVLARLGGNIAHQPRHLLEGRLERDHAQTHRGFLQIAHDLA